MDLISKQAVIDLLKQMRKDGDMVPWEGKDVFARIRNLPSAQPELSDEEKRLIKQLRSYAKIIDKLIASAQPEIIRCADCKHWREGDAYSYCQKLFNCGVLDVYDYMREEDDFCSLAERREE